VTHDPTIAEQTERVIRLRDGILDPAPRPNEQSGGGS